jgi:hypothetical protein
MTRFIIPLIITAALNSKDKFPNQKSEATLHHISVDTSLYCVFQYSNSMYRMFKNAKPASLSGLEIDSLEPIIRHATHKYNSSLKKPAERLHTLNQYKRQYVAVTTRNGQKEVWINFLCDVNNVQWRKNIIFTDDGGSCFFSLVVNLSSHHYYHLFVNGNA